MEYMIYILSPSCKTEGFSYAGKDSCQLCDIFPYCIQWYMPYIYVSPIYPHMRYTEYKYIYNIFLSLAD